MYLGVSWQWRDLFASAVSCVLIGSLYDYNSQFCCMTIKRDVLPKVNTPHTLLRRQFPDVYGFQALCLGPYAKPGHVGKLEHFPCPRFRVTTLKSPNLRMVITRELLAKVKAPRSRKRLLTADGEVDQRHPCQKRARICQI